MLEIVRRRQHRLFLGLGLMFLGFGLFWLAFDLAVNVGWARCRICFRATRPPPTASASRASASPASSGR